MASILLEYTDSFTTLREDLCTCIDNLERIELMVINCSNVYFLSWVGVKYVCIISVPMMPSFAPLSTRAPRLPR